MERDDWITWRKRITGPFVHGLLSGITLPVWVRLLIDNRFEISPNNWPRVVSITAAGLFNTIAGNIEARRFSDQYREIELQPPVIVLGAGRSGTTLLHNLLSLDLQWATPNQYQVRNPSTFLVTERAISQNPLWDIKGNRGIDNVSIAWTTPGEDEFATCLITTCSTLLSSVFPNHRGQYDKYSTFEDVGIEEIDLYKSALSTFLKKVTLLSGKPLILKSPNHMGRLNILGSIFPDARYILITRHPYAMYQSAVKAFVDVANIWSMQKTYQIREAEVFAFYSKILRSFFNQYPDTVKPKNFISIKYEDLVADPLGTMKKVYGSLGFDDYDTQAPVIDSYLSTLSGYRKNVYPELPANIRDRIKLECGGYFEQWGYRL
jgi:omega-hydroxy-beta-dihydromenaquinone-9 sulfotransferase